MSVLPHFLPSFHPSFLLSVFLSFLPFSFSLLFLSPPFLSFLPSLHQSFSKHMWDPLCAWLLVSPTDGLREPDTGPGPRELAFQEGQ